MLERLSDLVCVGAISAPHGVRGMVLVQSFTQNPLDLKSYKEFLDEQRKQIPLRFVSNTAKGGFISRIEGVDTRDDAEGYRRQKIYVTRESLPRVEGEDYYHIDLLECVVETLNGVVLGQVKAVHNYGAGDILDVSDGKESYMIPFHKEAVPMVDLMEKHIKVDDNFVCGRK